MKYVWILLYVVLAGWVTAPAIYSSQFIIAGEGEAACVIVHNGFEDQAADLKEYLDEMTGSDVPIAAELNGDDSEGAAIVVQIVDKVPGSSDRATAREAYRLHTEGNRLYLTASTGLGLSYAVWGLLEDHLGCRFYTPDAEVIPYSETVVLEGIEETCEPAFRSRRRITERALAAERGWMIKNRGLGLDESGFPSSHNFFSWIPPGEHFEDNPEWFALIDGERRVHGLMGLCGTNRDLAEKLAENLKARMAETDPSVPLRAGQGDGFVGCECAQCRELVEREGAEAAPLLLMLNRALEITSEKYPEHKVVTFAYYGTMPAPETMRPHPNLWINLVTTLEGRETNRLRTVRDYPANEVLRRAVRKWTDIAPGRVSIWDWPINFHAWHTEWPDIFLRVDDLRYYYEQGVSVWHPQKGNNPNWGELRRWLYTRLMWDPEADEGELIRDFLTGYYGREAGSILWDYLQYTADLVEKTGFGSGSHVGVGRLRTHLFTDEYLNRMTDMMERALEAAERDDDAVYAERVELAITRSVDALNLLGKDGRVLELGTATDARDGRDWVVPGGTPENILRSDRVASAYTTLQQHEWGGYWFARLRFLTYVGGPMHAVKNPYLHVETVPNLRGAVTSIVHQPTGRELLASDMDMGNVRPTWGGQNAFGYQDLKGHARIHEWEVTSGEPTVLEMAADHHMGIWMSAHAARAVQRLHRSVSVEEGAPILKIERKFTSQPIPERHVSHALPDPAEFQNRWRFAVAEPDDAEVSVTGGGLEKNVRIRGMGKLELMPESEEGDLVLRLDRGDGLEVILTTPDAGWKGLELESDDGGATLVVIMTTVPYPMDSAAETLIDDMAPQVLEVREL